MPVRSCYLIAFLFVLCACGDDDENDDATGNPPQEVAFTSFSNVLPGQTVTANGQSQTQNVVQNPSSGIVTGQTINAPDLIGVNSTWTYGTSSPLVPTGIRFVTPRIVATWNNGQSGQTVACDTQDCRASGGGSDGVLVNALGSRAWNYQTFGYWLSITGLPANIAASMTAGSLAPVGGIPVIGSATYNGISGGIYVGPAGSLQEHKALMTAVVDFDPIVRTVNFFTTVTTLRPWNTAGMSLAATPLNITGQLTYVAGSNRFTGPVTMGPSGSATMSGTATGVFYGPNAEEIGGTFSLFSPFSPQLESITGSFGGKR